MLHRPTLRSLAVLLLFAATLAWGADRQRPAPAPAAGVPADVARNMDAMRREVDTLRKRLDSLEKAAQKTRTGSPVPRQDTARVAPNAAGLVSDEAFRQKVLAAVAPRLQSIDVALATLAPLPARVQGLDGHRHGHGHGVMNSKTVVANPNQIVFVPNPGKDLNFSSKPVYSP